MNNQKQEINLVFTKERFPEGVHLCLIYKDIRAWLVEAGVEFPDAKENEPFGIFKAESPYCPNGRLWGERSFRIRTTYTAKISQGIQAEAVRV